MARPRSETAPACTEKIDLLLSISINGMVRKGCDSNQAVDEPVPGEYIVSSPNAGRAHACPSALSSSSRSSAST
jgi:hypothetical protein